MKRLILIAIAIFLILGCGSTATYYPTNVPPTETNPWGFNQASQDAYMAHPSISQATIDADELDRNVLDWEATIRAEQVDAEATYETLCCEDEVCCEISNCCGTSTGRSGSIVSQCLHGCTTHISGCDIKGNVSFYTNEKIYIVPGQEFYEETRIDPTYGERWFCTEEEAKANGWRKALN